MTLKIALILIGAILFVGTVKASAYTLIPLRSVDQDDIATLHPTYQLQGIILMRKQPPGLLSLNLKRWLAMAPYAIAIDAKTQTPYFPVPEGFYVHKLRPFPIQGKAHSVAITPTGRFAIVTHTPSRLIVGNWDTESKAPRILMTHPIKPATHVEFLSHSKLVLAYKNSPLMAYQIRRNTITPHMEVTQQLQRYGKPERVRDLARNAEGQLLILTDHHLTVCTSRGTLVRRNPINLKLVALTTDEENNLWLLDQNRRTIHHWSQNGQRLKQYHQFGNGKIPIDEIVVHQKFLGVSIHNQIKLSLIQKPLKKIINEAVSRHDS